MIEIIYENGGFIGSFGGDSFTAFFPVDSSGLKEEVYQNALYAMNDIKLFTKANNEIKTNLGSFNLKIKIGISEGIIDWGIVGSEHKKGYYFRSDAISRASDKASFHDDEDLSIKGIDTTKRKKELLQSSNYIIPDDILREFLPESITAIKEGEFRHVISIFILFQSELDYYTIDQLYEITSRLCNDYEGFLNKVDFADKGAKFVIFFGFPVAHEDDNRRALSFISEWQDLLMEKGINISYKIGIAQGFAYAGITGGMLRAEYTCLGDVVNLSARLASECDEYKVFCSKSVALEAKSYAHIPLCLYKEFKGKKGKLPVHLFISLKQTSIQKPFSMPLLGRDKEMEKAKQIINETILRRKFGGLLYIYGNAGIGKSRFVFAIHEWLENQSIEHNWVYLPCDGIVSRPWNGINQFLSNYFEISNQSEENDLRNFLRKMNELTSSKKIRDYTKNELLRVSPLLARELGLNYNSSFYKNMDAKLQMENLKSGLKELFKALSELKPTIIEIDDGQWLDSSTEEMLMTLTRNVSDFPFIILISCRNNDDGSKIKYTVPDECNVNEIDLLPLETDYNEQFSMHILGEGHLSRGIKKLLEEKASGIPFYIEQWLNHMKYTDAVKLINGEWVLSENEFTLPENIERILIAKIDSLGIDVKEILQYASILGVRFAYGILSKMLKKQYPLESYLNKAEKAQLIFHEGNLSMFDTVSRFSDLFYLFTHTIIRDVAYEMQVKERRKKLHSIALENIEKYCSSKIEEWYEDICIHAEKGDIRDKLLYYLEKSADHDKENIRYLNALEKYNKLNEILTDKKKKISINFKQVEICIEIAKYTEGLQILEKLESHLTKTPSSKILLARVYNDKALIYRETGNYSETIDYNMKALDLLINLKDKANIELSNTYNNLGSVYWAQESYLQSIDYYEKALALRQKEFGELNINVAEIYNNMGVVYYEKGDSSSALKYFENARNIVYELYGEEHPNLAFCYNNIGKVYCLLEDYEKAGLYFNKSLNLRIRFLGSEHPYIAFDYDNLGRLYKEQGAYEKAIECRKKALEMRLAFSGISHPFVAASYIGLGEIYKILKDYDNAIENLLRAVDSLLMNYNELHSKMLVPFILLAETYIEINYPNKAREYYEKVLLINAEKDGKDSKSVKEIQEKIREIERKERKRH